jgi:hypothetical protein
MNYKLAAAWTLLWRAVLRLRHSDTAQEIAFLVHGKNTCFCSCFTLSALRIPRGVTGSHIGIAADTRFTNDNDQSKNR